MPRGELFFSVPQRRFNVVLVLSAVVSYYVVGVSLVSFSVVSVPVGVRLVLCNVLLALFVVATNSHNHIATEPHIYIATLGSTKGGR